MPRHLCDHERSAVPQHTEYHPEGRHSISPSSTMSVASLITLNLTRTTHRSFVSCVFAMPPVSNCAASFATYSKTCLDQPARPNTAGQHSTSIKSCAPQLCTASGRSNNISLMYRPSLTRSCGIGCNYRCRNDGVDSREGVRPGFQRLLPSCCTAKSAVRP